MLQANKGNVISRFHKTSLEIRNMELTYYLTVFNRLSSISSILAGFAASGLTMSVPSWEDSVLVTAYLIFTSSAFGMNLLVILIATLCNLWGPGKALRGADQAHLHQAIEVLEQAQKEAMRFFVMGLFCYFISTILVVWLFFDKMGATVTTAILIIFCLMLVRQSLVIRRAFIPSEGFATGVLQGNPVRSRAE
ncbi:unnamed protein product [Effrenium voratum]|uniref:Uncharacterized protein n=1 Tax=Effrenium voratum TaxID=2562239 RepID=A0AA36JFP7_9DINO|nr:unnamed protein product [Effrenium voratum]CAJ1404772.1 unnamed protein product [Effrenium voratum]CAJ1436004.1 unnamed protein product [Effrenium voratum]